MRSRFEAFKNGDADWLLESWHASTRPATLDLSDNPVWRGVQILDTSDSDIVEFRATYLTQGGIGVLHERSRFVREDGRWFYLDGDMLET